MSIRLRFTLLYTVILALTLVFFGSTVYAVQSRSAFRNTKDALAGFARRLADARSMELNLSRWAARPSPPPDRAPERETFLIREPFRDQELYFQVRREDGQIIRRSTNLYEQTLPLSNAGLNAIRQDRPWTEAVSIGGLRVLVYSQPLRAPDGTLEIVQVARSVTDQDTALAALRRNLGIAGAIVVLAAFGIGWFFSGLVLRPITRITATAQAIGEEQDFGRRVEYHGPRDEVGRLVTTFNTMLAQLQAAYRRVEDALHLQRRFVADVSHELRTPLTTIRGNIELLQREPPISAEDRVAVVTDIADETQRLIRLVNDLLMLEHSDAGQRLRHEAISIQPLIEESCHQVAALDPERAITCSRIDSVEVIGDPDALKQVLLILLDNAIKHTSGPIEVTAAANAGDVAIAIRDHGPGIPADMIPKVFERFYRGEEARSKPGTGLGLSIAKALVEAQGGVIEVQSTVGQGSVFTVHLPAAGPAPIS